uniref:Uncharacterized protein n=1 Tax=Lepeophtheirus salmonis TaxID=72036 RepID=A0A0K2TR54_LEPSM
MSNLDWRLFIFLK